MDSATKCWYCVACKSRAEESVVQQLARRTDVAVFSAKVRTTVGRGTGKRTCLMPMFPGYVFVRMRLAASLIAIQYTPGIMDVVRFGSRIPTVPDSVIRELQELANRIPEPARNVVPAEGSTAHVERGPFRGFAGTILRMNSASERVQLLIEVLGQSRVLEIDCDAVSM